MAVVMFRYYCFWRCFLTNYCEFIFDISECPTIQVGPEDPAVIFSTSWTTGKGKGVVHSHKAILTTVVRMTHLPFTYPAPNLVLAKATHITGFLIPLGIMATGFSQVFTLEFSKQTVLDCIHTHKVCLISLNFYILYWLHRRLT